MTRRHRPGQRANHLVAIEIACDMAHCAMRVELAAVERGDPRRLLPAMLERVEPERDQSRRRAVGAGHAEHPALLAQMVVVEGVGGEHGSALSSRRAYRGADPLCRPIVT